MSTADIVKAQIAQAASRLPQAHRRKYPTRTADEMAEDEVWASWKRQLKARATGHRDLRY